ncbi:X8 domain [Sesbania bispinosa]|nr:X8 domain [Sesbania bispinosa]
MDTLSRITLLSASYNLHLPTTHALSPFQRAFSTKTNTQLTSVLRAGPPSPSVSDAEEDVLQMFFKERELNRDFISRASNILWQTKFRSSVGSDISNLTYNNSQQTEQDQVQQEHGLSQRPLTTSGAQWAPPLGGANCNKIQVNPPCYLPNTVRDHASYAFNNYYQRFKHKGASCYFNSAAITTDLDPSHGSCKFEFLPCIKFEVISFLNNEDTVMKSVLLFVCVS